MGNVRRTKEEYLKIWEMRDAGANMRQIGDALGLTTNQVKEPCYIKDREAFIRKYFDGNPFVPKQQNEVGRILTASEVKHKEGKAPDGDLFNRYISDKLPDAVLVIPDIQAPYHHPDTLPFLTMVAQRYQVDCVVGIGDELDLYQLSRFEKDPEAFGMSHELETGIKFWDEMFKMFPKAYALNSNHGRGRMEGARLRGGLAKRMMMSYQELIGAPRGWGFYDEVRLGDVLFMHGDGEKKITKPYLSFDIPREYGRHYSVVHGHKHEQHGRVADSILVGDDEYWGAYTGCLINPRAVAYGYTKARKARLGCLVIVKGVPHRIPMRTNDIGRWTLAI